MQESPTLTTEAPPGAPAWTPSRVYPSVEAEYEAAARRAGLVDRSPAGRLKLTGADSLDLLNRLTTNDLTRLAPGGPGAATVLTSNKGRVIDLLTVFSLEDGILVLTSPAARQRVAEWIDFYVIMDDVTVRDATEESFAAAVIGPDACGLLDGLTGGGASSLGPYGHRSVRIDGAGALLARTDFAGVPGYEIIAPADVGERLWTALAERGAEPVGGEALEALRIWRGVPAHGAELTEERNPLEAGLVRFVSFNKACYIGQEVVARLNAYDKVQRYLVGLSWKAEEGPGGKILFAGERAVGETTSSTTAPGVARAVGLGYVRRAHAGPGSVLNTAADGDGVEVAVEELPFRP